MTTEEKPRIKITYATLRADNEDLHAGFEAAVERVRGQLGGHHENYVDGAWRAGSDAFEVRTPVDRDVVLGTFATGTAGRHRRRCRRRARAQPAWAATPWRDRLAILRRAAELISDRLMDGAAVMSYRGRQEPDRGARRGRGVGRPHPLLRQTMEDNEGYDHAMGNLGDSAVHTRSILRPHGVFAVVSPFNFPMALAAGPTSAAMIAGNTVVFKPSSASPLVGGQAHRGVPSTPACRAASSTWSWVRARRSVRRSRTTPASTASCSPARTRSGCACSIRSAGRGPARRSSRWAARTRPS